MWKISFLAQLYLKEKVNANIIFIQFKIQNCKAYLGCLSALVYFIVMSGVTIVIKDKACNECPHKPNWLVQLRLSPFADEGNQIEHIKKLIWKLWSKHYLYLNMIQLSGHTSIKLVGRREGVYQCKNKGFHVIYHTN